MDRVIGVSPGSHMLTSREIYERHVQKREDRFAAPPPKRTSLEEEPTGALALFRHLILELVKACFYGSGGAGMYRSVREFIAASAEEATRFQSGLPCTDSAGAAKADWLG